MRTLKLISICLFAVLVRAESSPSSGWITKAQMQRDGDLNAIFFVDQKRGWIGGDGGVVLSTQDEGTFWKRYKLPINESVNDIFFRNKDEGFLVASNRIFATTDSGHNWRESRRISRNYFRVGVPELYSIRFTNKKRGWIVGSVSQGEKVIDSLILYTVDGGETWNKSTIPSSSELINLDFVGEDHGWIVGASGTILHTSKGGAVWSSQRSPVAATLYSVDFRNRDEGLAVGEKGTILRTTDGGRSWIQMRSPVRTSLMSVRFTDDKNAWAVGHRGSIIRTNDGGRTWVQQVSRAGHNIYGLAVAKKSAWAVGGKGLILNYRID
jgi:photosystem II stability/assembly factor-like uncharacterized protein